MLRAGLPVLRRRTLLLDQAARVEARGARRRGDLLRVATWRLAATGTADPALLVQAAALARHAHDYQQTVALLTALPEKHHTTATGLMLGNALFEMARFDEAEEALAQAGARAVDARERLAVTLVRTTNLLWSNAPLGEALAVNDTALAGITGPAERRKLEINEGFMRIAAGEPVRGLALLEDLETDVGDAADVDVWLRGAWMKPFGLALVGRTGEAAVWAERAHAGHRRVDEHALVSHPAVQRIPLVLALCEAGRPAEALREGERAYAELVAADSVVRVWLAVFLAASSGWPGIPSPPAAGGPRPPCRPAGSTTSWPCVRYWAASPPVPPYWGTWTRPRPRSPSTGACRRWHRACCPRARNDWATRGCWPPAGTSGRPGPC
ncbi:hypothetical protein [Streptomyces sp. ME109]|uniref:hypothetical protein n=1 Tax=Streptomyces sp. me109 TaxID=1827853 RepID=UPI0021C67650|nr:hypothetical protein [Streptomyces sp. me109]